MFVETPTTAAGWVLRTGVSSWFCAHLLGRELSGDNCIGFAIFCCKSGSPPVYCTKELVQLNSDKTISAEMGRELMKVGH